jgi:hypothetical protein
MPFVALVVGNLDRGAVAHHDRGQLGGRRCAADRSGESPRLEQRESSAVVQVGVREHDGGELVAAHEPTEHLISVAALDLRRALMQSEVDEQRGAGALQQRGRTRDLAGGAKKGELHERCGAGVAQASRRRHARGQSDGAKGGSRSESVSEARR